MVNADAPPGLRGASEEPPTEAFTELESGEKAERTEEVG
jgi:hypothetical protein